MRKMEKKSNPQSRISSRKGGDFFIPWKVGVPKVSLWCIRAAENSSEWRRKGDWITRGITPIGTRNQSMLWERLLYVIPFPCSSNPGPAGELSTSNRWLGWGGVNNKLLFCYHHSIWKTRNILEKFLQVVIKFVKIGIENTFLKYSFKKNYLLQEKCSFEKKSPKKNAIPKTENPSWKKNAILQKKKGKNALQRGKNTWKFWNHRCWTKRMDSPLL